MSKNNSPSDSESPAPEPVAQPDSDGQLVPRSWDEVVEELKIGVEDAGEKLAVDAAELAGAGRVRVVLHEGKKRHLRRIFAKLGFAVEDLLRWRVGAWTIEKIPEGGREKLEFEKSELEKILGGK